jgi:hypothetical protein
MHPSGSPTAHITYTTINPLPFTIHDRGSAVLQRKTVFNAFLLGGLTIVSNLLLFIEA